MASKSAVPNGAPGFSTKQPKVILGKGGVTSAGWHSVADAFRCLKAYQLAKVRGVRVPSAQTPDHFAVGQLFHAGRARWFAHRFKRDDKTWASVQGAVEGAAVEAELPVSQQAVQNALSYLTQYMDHYSVRPLPNPVAAEYLLGPSPLVNGDPVSLHRTARLDDASYYMEAGGKLCVGESKTTSTSIDDTVKQYELHGQTLLQLALWKMDPKGEAMHGPAAGIMLDVTVKGYKGTRCKFGRVFLPISDHALSWYVAALRQKLQQVAAINWDTRVPHNPAGCTYMAGRSRVDCTFKDLCRHGRSATGQYVLAGGTSMLDKKAWKGETPPWE